MRDPPPLVSNPSGVYVKVPMPAELLGTVQSFIALGSKLMALVDEIDEEIQKTQRRRRR